MTREEKCKLAIEKGYCYDKISGFIFNKKGKQITAKRRDGYIKICLRENNMRYDLRAHQFAWYYTFNECVDCIDHINNIRDDNRIENLRSITHQENCLNTKKPKGYCYDKKNQNYYVRISREGKMIESKRFNNEEDASKFYIELKKIHHII